MSRIDLKFSPEMAKAALDGRKCCTSRRTVKGAPGDEFEISGVRFRLLDVQRLSAGFVARNLCRLEGFVGIEDCAAALQRLYPDVRQYDSLNVHFFARCP